jgi:hypothetical protein
MCAAGMRMWLKLRAIGLKIFTAISRVHAGIA